MAPISFSDSDAIPDLPISHEDRAANGLPSPTPGHAGRTAADLAARKMADPLAPTDPTKRIEDARLHSRCSIEREYAASGYQPVMAGDLILSPSLLKSIGKWPPAPKPNAG